MNELAGLIEAIRLDPNNNLVRKVLADALEDRGHGNLAGLIRRTGIVRPLKIGGDGGDGDGGYGGYGGGGGYKKSIISEGIAMNDGLYLLLMPGGWAPYALIGWATRDDLFVRMRNCRIIRRFGGEAQLTHLAKGGPQSDTQLLDMSEEESVMIVQISRAIPCNPAKWARECPEPVYEVYQLATSPIVEGER